jgi:ankyrin repeat protein
MGNDENGFTPLHHVAKRRRPASAKEELEIVTFLVNACPQALREKSLTGKLPLHVAAACGRCIDGAHHCGAIPRDVMGPSP